MTNNQQQTPMTGKGKLSLLIAGAVLSMAVSAPTLAATAAKTTTVSATSAPTLAVIGHAPVIKTEGTVTADDVDNDKVLGINDTLTVSGFVFEDADKDIITSITYKWLADGTAISGETKEKLTLTKNLLGKKITVEAIAHTDPSITDPAQSTTPVAAKAYIDITNTDVGNKGISTVNGNVVKSVAITGLTSGKPLVGTKLTATATCYGTCDNSETYQWQIEGTAGAYTDIKGETTSTYTVKNTDQKKKIQVIASSK